MQYSRMDAVAIPDTEPTPKCEASNTSLRYFETTHLFMENRPCFLCSICSFFCRLFCHISLRSRYNMLFCINQQAFTTSPTVVLGSCFLFCSSVTLLGPCLGARLFCNVFLYTSAWVCEGFVKSRILESFSESRVIFRC